MESSPSEGPTVLSSMTFTGAGRAPALKTVARSLASSALKLPSIMALPSGILERITGADWTMSSRTIARFLSIFLSVISAKALPPSLLNS